MQIRPRKRPILMAAVEQWLQAEMQQQQQQLQRQ